MSTDTIRFLKGSTFEFEGQVRDPDGVGIPIPNTEIRVYEALGAGMQDLQIEILDVPTGKFRVSLDETESQKLPEGRSSWFKLQLDYVDTTKKVVFPAIWVNTV